MAVAALGMISFMTLIICLVWLTVVAGRSSRDEELHLNWFDAWKTELAAAVIIVLWLIPMLVSGSVISVTDILLGVMMNLQQCMAIIIM